jgi:hypothetical protein
MSWLDLSFGWTIERTMGRLPFIVNTNRGRHEPGRRDGVIEPPKSKLCSQAHHGAIASIAAARNS